MHSAGLELTKPTYTRLEDNLIRHRGDRLILTPDRRQHPQLVFSVQGGEKSAPNNSDP